MTKGQKWVEAWPAVQVVMIPPLRVIDHPPEEARSPIPSMRLLLLWRSLLAVLQAACFASSLALGQTQGPPIPYIRIGACPFEGCQYGTWTTQDPLRGYVAEGDTISTGFTLRAGETFQAISGNLHVDRPGIVKILKNHLQYHQGDTVYVLSYAGEGSYTIWYRGRFDDADIFWQTHQDFLQKGEDSSRYVASMAEAPTMVWWVKIRNTEGRAGWLRLVNISDEGFEIAESIRGMDRLGD